MLESDSPDTAATSHRSSPYWWFEGASVRALVERIGTCGGPDAVRLEVHLHGDKMTFVVTGTAASGYAGTDDPPINDSHVCPPFCA